MFVCFGLRYVCTLTLATGLLCLVESNPSKGVFYDENATSINFYSNAQCKNHVRVELERIYSILKMYELEQLKRSYVFLTN